MSTDHPHRRDDPAGTRDAARYEIRLRGRLGDRWEAWFEGFDLEIEGDATVLRGSVADQAALHGVLHRVRDIGIPLTSLTVLPPAPHHDSPGASS